MIPSGHILATVNKEAAFQPLPFAFLSMSAAVSPPAVSLSRGHAAAKLCGHHTWMNKKSLQLSPTDPFTTLEFQNPWIDSSKLHKTRLTPGLEALEL